MIKIYRSHFQFTCFLILLLFQVACKSKLPIISENIEKKDSIVAVKKIKLPVKKSIQIGAAQLSAYLPDLQGKKVALVVNHTALIGNTHLADTLLRLGIHLQKVFVPEHGFRGNADAGEHIDNSKDSQTGLPLISLYGNNKKPTAEQVKDIDVIVFDMQDVGIRFYTYISTMHYVMEACAENGKKMLILDRPNPNGSYIDGPIREFKFKSFVGMHPIPIVHGCTVGELALMINGEKWLTNGLKCDLKIIKLENYHHAQAYSIPVKPSPNLPNDLSIQLYPSICLFEGTSISVGRGTQFPFQIIGAPQKNMGYFFFIPQSIEGMAKNPKYLNQTCYGLDLRNTGFKNKFTLKYLIDFYHLSDDKAKFFNGYFDTLAGTASLQTQIKAGWTEKEIRKTWDASLQNYRKIREKYLLYP